MNFTNLRASGELMAKWCWWVGRWRWRSGMNRSKTVAFLWLFSALFFYSLFQMALRNSDSSHNYTSASGNFNCFPSLFHSFCLVPEKLGSYSTLSFQILRFPIRSRGPPCTIGWLGIWISTDRFFSNMATLLSLSRFLIFLPSRMDL